MEPPELEGIYHLIFIEIYRTVAINCLELNVGKNASILSCIQVNVAIFCHRSVSVLCVLREDNLGV